MIGPTFDSTLDHCRVLYDSIRGPIETEWTAESGRCTPLVRIPANVTGTSCLEDQLVEGLFADAEPLANSGITIKEEVVTDRSQMTLTNLPSRCPNKQLPKSKTTEITLLQFN